MAAGQQRLAHLILSDPEGCAFRTIGETARMAEVHESSVVRFSSALGLDGYPGLVQLCRQHLREQAQLVRRFEEAQRNQDSNDLLATVAAFDERNLARTYARIDRQDWHRAVTLLADAPAIHVIGLWKCFSIAHLLAHLLHLVRRKVYLLYSVSGLLIDQLHDISPDDVLVAISIHRYVTETLRAVAFAHEQKVRTIVLTDNPASPLVPYADVIFYVETSGVTILRSVAAFSSLVQALATAVALQLGTRSRTELVIDEELYQGFGAFVEQSSMIEEPKPTRSTSVADKPRQSRKQPANPSGRSRAREGPPVPRKRKDELPTRGAHRLGVRAGTGRAREVPIETKLSERSQPAARNPAGSGGH